MQSQSRGDDDAALHAWLASSSSAILSGAAAAAAAAAAHDTMPVATAAAADDDGADSSSELPPVKRLKKTNANAGQDDTSYWTNKTVFPDLDAAITWLRQNFYKKNGRMSVRSFFLLGSILLCATDRETYLQLEAYVAVFFSPHTLPGDGNASFWRCTTRTRAPDSSSCTSTAMLSVTSSGEISVQCNGKHNDAVEHTVSQSAFLQFGALGPLVKTLFDTNPGQYKLIKSKLFEFINGADEPASPLHAALLQEMASSPFGPSADERKHAVAAAQARMKKLIPSRTQVANNAVCCNRSVLHLANRSYVAFAFQWRVKHEGTRQTALKKRGKITQLSISPVPIYPPSAIPKRLKWSSARRNYRQH